MQFAVCRGLCSVPRRYSCSYYGCRGFGICNDVSFSLSSLGIVAGHDEDRLALKIVKFWRQTLSAVMFRDVDDFLGGGNRFDGHVAVTAVFQHHEAPGDIF